MYLMYAEGVPDLHANDPVLRFHTYAHGPQFDVSAWVGRFAALIEKPQHPERHPLSPDLTLVRTADPITVVSTTDTGTSIGYRYLEDEPLMSLPVHNPLVLPEQAASAISDMIARRSGVPEKAIRKNRLELFHKGLLGLTLEVDEAPDESPDHAATLFGAAALQEAFDYFSNTARLSPYIRERQRHQRLLAVASTALLAADIDVPLVQL